MTEYLRIPLSRPIKMFDGRLIDAVEYLPGHEDDAKAMVAALESAIAADARPFAEKYAAYLARKTAAQTKTNGSL